MTRTSLRWIFLIPTLAVIIVGFTAFAIYADRVEHANRIADIDAELVKAQQRNGANFGAAQTPVRPPPGEEESGQESQGRELPVQELVLEETDIDIENPVQLRVDLDGSVTTVGVAGNPFMAPTLERLASTAGFSTAAEENYRVLVIAQEGRPAELTAFSLDSVDRASTEFRRAVALGGTVIAILVAVVVWLLVLSFTGPITRIAGAARRIADGELDAELEVSSRSHELTDLSNDLERMLARLKSTVAASEMSAAEATQARDDMQQFLADMAHELLTPLTALKGYSDLYAGGMLEGAADVDRAMSRIGSESERLYRLADDMLQLARHGSANEVYEIVNVPEIAAVIAADLKAANPDHTISLDIDSGDNRIMGMPARIHQAILNLAANACQHSDPADEITIQIEDQTSTVAVRVIDHGAGIDPTDYARIFVPFYQADASRSRTARKAKTEGAKTRGAKTRGAKTRGAKTRGGGAGLGLALTKKIVDEHDGTIAVQPTPGGGATLVLELPKGSVKLIGELQPVP